MEDAGSISFHKKLSLDIHISRFNSGPTFIFTISLATLMLALSSHLRLVLTRYLFSSSFATKVRTFSLYFGSRHLVKKSINCLIISTPLSYLSSKPIYHIAFKHSMSKVFINSQSSHEYFWRNMSPCIYQLKWPLRRKITVLRNISKAPCVSYRIRFVPSITRRHTISHANAVNT